MVLPMARPTKRPHTRSLLARKVIPPDVRHVFGKTEFVRSLRTSDPAAAKRLQAEIMAEWERQIGAARAQLRGELKYLSQREVLAIAGEWYAAEVAEWEDDPGQAAGWDGWLDSVAAAADEAAMEEAGEDWQYVPNEQGLTEAAEVLRRRGIAAEPGSLRRFAAALIHAKVRFAATMKRRAEGDYSPDQYLPLYPKHPASVPSALAAAPHGGSAKPLPAAELVAAWAAERKPSAATRAKYEGTFRRIASFLGFDDLRRIAPEDVVRFKRHRLDVEKRDVGTVEDDVRNAGAVCRWGERNRLLSSNPFQNLAPEATRKVVPSRVPYDDADAAKILAAARLEAGWLRWAPWLLCFTGARLGELAELRRGDVREEAGVPFLDVRPHETRPGKNAIMQRMIPLHPALIAEGFLAYVSELPADPNGPLFPSITPDPHGKRTTPAQTKLGRWMRDRVQITDPKKAPAHSWRHRMEDELRKVRAPEEVQDAITGRHNPRNAGAGYGKGFRGMPAEVLRELARIPAPLSPLGATGGTSDAAGEASTAALARAEHRPPG